MSAYLVDHPPARSQYRKGRRATPTGTIVLHTAEIAPDLTGDDSGAETIARFISTRTDAPGSYHLLGDRDSEILVVPLEWEAFHDGTGSNPFSIGISLAITAAWFRAASNEEKLWYMVRLATMARRASDWLEATHGITVPARRLTKASQNEAGFCAHMDRENWEGTPGRRSDPWGDSDDMWHLFLTLYEDTAQEDAMTPDQEKKIHGRIDGLVDHIDTVNELVRYCVWQLEGDDVSATAAGRRSSHRSLMKQLAANPSASDPQSVDTQAILAAIDDLPAEVLDALREQLGA